MIDVRNVSGGYNGVDVIHNISFSIPEGTFFGIIGPNGSGKSTLLRYISGIAKPTSGEVLFLGKPIFSYSRKDIAKQMAVLPQEQNQPFSFSVREIVAMGRYPFQSGLIPIYSKEDLAIVDHALEDLHLKEIEHEPFDQLSGGQKQRTILARILAQQPKIILLDEPMNHLDVYYQVEVLRLLKSWIKTKKITIISVLHDINLTALFSDQLLVLSNKGEIAALGSTKEVLNSTLLHDVFGIQTVMIEHPITKRPQFFLQP